MERQIKANSSPLSLSEYNSTVNIEQVISGIHGLSASDFDLNDVNSNGMEKLYELTDAVSKLPNPELAIPEMFELMERLPDAEMGSPGPLVHTLEAIPGYEVQLAESIRRKPSLLAMWMANRILNSPIAEGSRQDWMTLLQDSADRPDVPLTVRQNARDFLSRQRAKQQP
jgi:hypothetical protein